MMLGAVFWFDVLTTFDHFHGRYRRLLLVLRVDRVLVTDLLLVLVSDTGLVLALVLTNRLALVLAFASLLGLAGKILFLIFVLLTVVTVLLVC